MTTREVTAESRTPREVLAWSRDLVEPATRAAVETLPESMRRIAGYHYGWWDEHGRPADASGGKALRPTLTLLAAQAVGGLATAAVPAAVAIELVHNFSLLHDDVIDGDVTRRHRPTAWSVFGRSAAILAGDSLVTLAFDVLAASGHPDAVEGMRVLSAAIQHLVEGQSLDVEFEDRRDIALAECVTMAHRKTGALISAACSIGALFGGGRSAQVDHLRCFGDELGLAFQLVDDLLGIWGDPVSTGKPVFSDLHNRKKSLPVVAALNSHTIAGQELGELYHSDRPLSGTDVARAAELIDLAGGREWCRVQADDRLATAIHRLRSADPPAGPAAELSGLAGLVTHRDH
ncbi:family 2 encapsulin nanocompartment cargo protein polyprenyl transferase [Kibdelosporangium phytohabitans]|uniref:Dimethylallyltranstransferase n=1 Tax=Kibdelosporangium phytohabitans TaxID=860235 RepID=A0A0N9IAY0_9PSEU|nr:family 2 encapsulin nanocompartment cargo protein polyprenyl transferase [Kibdelosporangium phytohabitans]ALG12282.1 dimethylallyltranstransferase [Kibdelosporangium phytohabitans]MBE1463836.1 geranylgeranyl diphosphate synthase type I [Kibdelosporangium phytohabitans]